MGRQSETSKKRLQRIKAAESAGRHVVAGGHSVKPPEPEYLKKVAAPLAADIAISALPVVRGAQLAARAGKAIASGAAKHIIRRKAGKIAAKVAGAASKISTKINKPVIQASRNRRSVATAREATDVIDRSSSAIRSAQRAGKVPKSTPASAKEMEALSRFRKGDKALQLKNVGKRAFSLKKAPATTTGQKLRTAGRVVKHVAKKAITNKRVVGEALAAAAAAKRIKDRARSRKKK